METENSQRPHYPERDKERIKEEMATFQGENRKIPQKEASTLRIHTNRLLLIPV